MKKQLIYLDTSVIGGCFDEEFSHWSNKLFHDIQSGIYDAATSDIVAAELKMAPDEVRRKYADLLEMDPHILEININVETLAEAYIGHRILPEKYKTDMLHIALATVHNADIVVSWNFKHIVHFEKIVKFNAVNLEYGFRQIMILSPREVATYEEI